MNSLQKDDHRLLIHRQDSAPPMDPMDPVAVVIGDDLELDEDLGPRRGWRNLYGIYMGFIWDLWDLYGIYMGFIWDLYGIYMGFMGFIWDLYGIYMGFIWDLWVYMGENMGFIWGKIWIY